MFNMNPNIEEINIFQNIYMSRMAPIWGARPTISTHHGLSDAMNGPQMLISIYLSLVVFSTDVTYSRFLLNAM